MVCRHCGIEISDKALICYRCGASTAEPVAPAKRAGGAGRRSLVMSLVALAALVLAAVFMGRVVTDEVPRWVSWTLAALAGVLLIWWLARRGAK